MCSVVQTESKPSSSASSTERRIPSGEEPGPKFGRITPRCICATLAREYIPGMGAWRHRLVPIAASVGAVAAVTLAIYPLKLFAPVLSLGALYVLAVLPIAVWWGLA